MTQTITLSFFRFSRWRDRAWALTMMGGARMAMARVPDLSFWKLCGSGTGEGFTPVPNTGVYSILCVWPDKNTATTRMADTPIFDRYRKRADEHWTVFLSPTSSRGEWSGSEPFLPVSEPVCGPLAALTRATVKPSRMMKFWDQAPNVNKLIDGDPNVVFKIGIGEVPLLHQVTFSIWPDTSKMAEFARKSGPHADAIRAVRDGNWFAEELYARFAILGDSGAWNGASPLDKLERTP